VAALDRELKTSTFSLGKIKNNESLVSFTSFSNNDAIKWIIREVNKTKKQISYDVAQNLQYSVGNDAAILKNEIDKLIAYVDDENTIKNKDIESISTKSVNYSVFNMTDALLSLNINEAIKIAKNLLKNGEAEYMLFAMLLREFRISYYIKALLSENVNTNEIQKIVEIPPFAINKRINIIKKYSLNILLSAYQYCINTDYLFKSGQISQIGITERSIFGINCLLKKDK
ncbi:MAG: DNA polymerase III subunit delta, partial [Christensenellaceae bacterium]|nr:DNA polymerase III subunit delta [Christensenellaceae bacterium]